MSDGPAEHPAKRLRDLLGQVHGPVCGHGTSRIRFHDWLGRAYPAALPALDLAEPGDEAHAATGSAVVELG
jgi:hypothetical protein